MGCTTSRDVVEPPCPDDAERSVERKTFTSLRPLVWALKFASLDQQFRDAAETVDAFSADELQEFEPQFLDSPQLTSTELEWIVKVRDAAMASPFKHLCSCAMLVQLAIATQGNGTLAVKRLAKLSKWLSEPSVASKSPHECLDEAATFSHPHTAGFGLSVPMTMKDGTCGLAADYANFDAHNLTAPLVVKALVACFEDFACSLNNVRRGYCVVAHVPAGMRSISPQLELAMSRVYTAGYPMTVRKILIVDASRLTKFALKMLGPLLGEAQQKKIVQITCKEAYGEYLAKETTPTFLGGTTGPAEMASCWAALRAQRVAWENELAEEFGTNFAKL